MNERSLQAGAQTDRAAGFGLVEVVVAMFLLAMLAVAFLPFLVQGVTRSAENGTLAAATQLANKEMENARARTTCSALTGSTFSVLDPQGVTLQVVRAIGGICPAAAASYPVTVPVTVTVTRTDTGTVVSTATTLIFVAAL